MRTHSLPRGGTDLIQQRSGVALQSGKLCAFHRAAAESFNVVLMRHVDDVRERRIDVSLTWLKALFSRSLLKTVPGTNVLTDVAAVKPAFELISQLAR